MFIYKNKVFLFIFFLILVFLYKQYMMFKKHKVTFLNESWKIVKTDVSVKAIPRIHEIVYLVDELKYYRVVNVVHNIDKNHTIYVIIEEYADDYALIEKKSKKNLT